MSATNNTVDLFTEAERRSLLDQAISRALEQLPSKAGSLTRKEQALLDLLSSGRLDEQPTGSPTTKPKSDAATERTPSDPQPMAAEDSLAAMYPDLTKREIDDVMEGW